MLSSQLRSEFANIDEILSDNMEYVKCLYDQCLVASLDENFTNEESHNAFCTITAICLLNDIESIDFPIGYAKEDFELLATVMNSIDLLLTVEAMADKNIIERKIIDGKVYYTAKE
jgi:hypothetical protein